MLKVINRRNFLKGVAGASLLVVTLFFVTSFAAMGQKQLLFGYTAPGLGDEGQVNIQGGFVEKCEELGIKVITTNAERDAAKQVSDVEDLIARGVDAICGVPFDSKVISVAVKKANVAGIPFFTIDRGVTEGKLTLTVLADNYGAGEMAGEVMVRLLQGKYNGIAKGKVLEIEGQPGQDVAQLRGDGFKSVIKKYPDIELISKPGNWDSKKGFEITQDVLVAHPDIDGIYYHADLYIPGIVEGIKALKGEFKKVGEEGHVYILGIDGNPMGLANIRERLADGVMVQPLRDFGHVIVPIIVDYLEKGEAALPKPGVIQIEGMTSYVVETPIGLQVKMETFYADHHNAADPTLWGNRALR